MSTKLIRPTDIEEARISAATHIDPDNPPLKDTELRQFQRVQARSHESKEKGK